MRTKYTCDSNSFLIFSMLWNFASARDDISLCKWSVQLCTLEGSLVARNALCWQQTTTTTTTTTTPTKISVDILLPVAKTFDQNLA